MNEDTLTFIRQHLHDDVRSLALSADKNTAIDMPFALSQIAGWQTACRKLPSWSQTDGIVYPQHLSLEQCSSEPTARYKASLLQPYLSSNIPSSATLLVDLTGGFGVDFSFMASTCSSDGTGCIYIERNRQLCDIMHHNLPLLSLPKAQVVCGDATEFLQTLHHSHFIYLDPARRDTNGARTYAIADCTPDVTSLCDMLLHKADIVIIKLSPMLDWHKAVSDLKCVREVHIVSVGNECKELLLILSSTGEDHLKVVCINNDSVFEIHNPDTLQTPPLPPITPNTCVMPQPSAYLCVPNASVMKSGCFTQLTQLLPVSPVSSNSHLFVAAAPVSNFPGRQFQIRAVSSMNKRELRTVLQGITSANIAVRNFPLTAVELRKRLRLKDGGDTYIFATTSAQDKHILVICTPFAP